MNETSNPRPRLGDEGRVCVVCGRPSWAVVSISGDIWKPYPVCFEHRLYDERIAKEDAHGRRA